MKLLRYLKSFTFAATLFVFVIVITIAFSTHAGNTSDLVNLKVQPDRVITELKNLPLMEISPESDRFYSPLSEPDFKPAFDLLSQRK